MAPSKSSKNANDETKPELSHTKDRAAHSGSHPPNGKLRRVGSSTGSNLREVANAAAPVQSALPAEAPTQSLPSTPSLQWSAFDRDVLHAYRRLYRLNTPTAFSNEYHHWVLSQPSNLGLHSPTMARRKEFRRQSKEQLTHAVRKHFNGIGVQENDIVVDFLHKVSGDGISKAGKWRRPENTTQSLER